MSRLVLSVGPAWGRIHGRVSPELADRLEAVCSYPKPGADYAAHIVEQRVGFQWTKSRVYYPRVYLYNRNTQEFPAGLAPRVQEVLLQRDVPHVYEEDAPDAVALHLVRPAAIPDPDPDYAPREYQESAILDVLDHRRRMVQMATGGGKTVVAGHVMHRLGLRACFLVHTKDLLYQAVEAFEAMFHREAGIIGDGNVKIRDVTVATLQTMARGLGVTVSRVGQDEDDLWDDRSTKFEKARALSYASSVGVVFMDECHRVAAPMASGVMLSFQNARRYGLSASPWRDDGADIVLEGIFGQVGPQISASELIAAGYLVPPYIRMRHVSPVAYTREQKYSEVYEDYVVCNEERNEIGIADACSMVRRGRPTLVLVRRLVHGDAIAQALSQRLGFGVPFLSGADEGILRRDVMQDVREGRLGCVAATTIADEGLDVKPLSGLVLLGGGKSSCRALQRVGRVLRPWEGKEDAEVTDFDDNARYLVSHTAAREKLYGTEPGFTLLD